METYTEKAIMVIAGNGNVGSCRRKVNVYGIVAVNTANNNWAQGSQRGSKVVCVCRCHPSAQRSVLSSPPLIRSTPPVPGRNIARQSE